MEESFFLNERWWNEIYLPQENGSREHLKIAQQYFQLVFFQIARLYSIVHIQVGGSASECDTIPGRQCMAACFFLLKQFDDVLLYLNRLAAHRLWLNIDVPASRATTTTTTCSTLTMGKPRLRSATIRFNQFRKKTFVEERKIRKRKKSSWTSLRRSWSQTTLTFPGSQDASLWTGRWVRMERMLTWNIFYLKARLAWELYLKMETSGKNCADILNISNRHSHCCSNLEIPNTLL